MKQEVLAERSGYSRNSIINWETGKRIPRANDITRLALVLGVSETDLIEDNSNDVYIQKPVNDLQPVEVGSYAYWGGIVDETLRIVERGDTHKLSLIAPILKFAYKTISSRL